MSHLNTDKIVFQSDVKIREYSRLVIEESLFNYENHSHNHDGICGCNYTFLEGIRTSVDRIGKEQTIENYARVIIETKNRDPNVRAALSSGKPSKDFANSHSPETCKFFKVNFIYNQGTSIDFDFFINALNFGFSDKTVNTSLYGDRKQLDCKIRFEKNSTVELTGDKIITFTSRAHLNNVVLSTAETAAYFGFKPNMINIYFAAFSSGGAEGAGAYAHFPTNNYPRAGTTVWPTSSLAYALNWIAKSIVHEIGHNFNLAHPFGDDGLCSDDEVSDTPLTVMNETTTRTSACGEPSMNENYMDYVPYEPQSYFFFTVGQSSRMHASIENLLGGYYENRSCEPPNPLEPPHPGRLAPPHPGDLPLVRIKYGNFDFTENNLFVPYLSRDQEFVSYKGKFGQITKITLEGNIGGAYKQIDEERSLILKAFLNDFQDLTVREFAGLDNGDGNLGLIIKFERCIVKSVNFSAVNSGITNYQIELECIEKSLFAHSYGILNPKNEYSFSELENGFIQISHSISAEGIVANGKSAMANAKEFVESKKGYDIKTISPSLAPFTGGLGVGSFSIILTETSINANVINSEYSIEETFLVHSHNAVSTIRISDVVSTSSCSFEKSIQGDFFSVKVDFSIQGGKDTDEDLLRSKIPSSDQLYITASLAAADFVLNKMPTDFTVSDEAATSQKIKITASYDTNSISFADKFLTVDGKQVYTSSGGVYFDYSVDFSTDYITDVTTVKISGEVIARDNIINKYQKIKTFYEQKVLSLGVSNYLYYLAKNSYEKNISFPWKLNPNSQSFSLTENRNKGTISLNSSFTNKDYLPSCYQAKYSVSVTPRIKKYHSVASCNLNGLYGVFDINQVTTEEININGSIQNKKDQTKVELLNSYSGLMNNLKSNFVDRQILFKEQAEWQTITKESLTIGETPTFNINFSHGFKVDSFFIRTD